MIGTPFQSDPNSSEYIYQLSYLLAQINKGIENLNNFQSSKLYQFLTRYQHHNTAEALINLDNEHEAKTIPLEDNADKLLIGSKCIRNLQR